MKTCCITFLRYSQNHQNQVYLQQSILTWHRSLRYQMWWIGLRPFVLSREIVRQSLWEGRVGYWTGCWPRLIYQDQIHLMRGDKMWLEPSAIPSLSFSRSLALSFSFCFHPTLPCPFSKCALWDVDTTPAFVHIRCPIPLPKCPYINQTNNLPTTMAVNWKPFFTDLRWTWLGRLAKPT